MASKLLLGICGFLLLCAAVVDSQYASGSPDSQIYIRNGKEGAYNVPGVPGQFQYSASGGVHEYTDEHGNTYTHRKKTAGGAGGHSISGPGIDAQNQQSSGINNAHRRVRSPQLLVTRPDRRVVVGNDGSFLAQRQVRSPQYSISRPDRRVDVGGDGSFLAQRQVRSPQGNTQYFPPGSEIHVTRPGHSVHSSNGGLQVHRQSRSPHHTPDHNDDHEHDEHDHEHDDHDDHHKRIRRARVQGENFVARDDQAGVWNGRVSVWKRPDGRTVTVDQNGNVITSGSPNGRGPQYYSG